MPTTSYMAPYSDQQLAALHGCQLASATLSVIMGIVGISFWARMAPQRRNIFRMHVLQILILWDMLKALLLFVVSATRMSWYHHIKADYTYNGTFCDGFGFLITTVTFYSDALMFTITVHNGLLVFYPAGTTTYTRRIISPTSFIITLKEYVSGRLPRDKFLEHYEDGCNVITVNEGVLYRYKGPIAVVMFLTGPTLAAMVFVGTAPRHFMNNHMCSVPQLPLWKRLVSDWAFKYLNILTIVCVYSCMIFYLRYRFIKIKDSKIGVYENNMRRHRETMQPISKTQHLTNSLQKELMSMARDSSERRLQSGLRELKLFIIYPVGYILVWITPMVVQIWNYVRQTEDLKPFALTLVSAITIPMSCCVDTVIFLVREQPWLYTQSRMRRNSAKPSTMFDLFGDTLPPGTTEDTMVDPHEGSLVSDGAGPNQSMAPQEQKYTSQTTSGTLVHNYKSGFDEGGLHRHVDIEADDDEEIGDMDIGDFLRNTGPALR